MGVSHIRKPKFFLWAKSQCRKPKNGSHMSALLVCGGLSGCTVQHRAIGIYNRGMAVPPIDPQWSIWCGDDASHWLGANAPPVYGTPSGTHIKKKKTHTHTHTYIHMRNGWHRVWLRKVSAANQEKGPIFGFRNYKISFYPYNMF
jgi:hypothetical protein